MKKSILRAAGLLAAPLALAAGLSGASLAGSSSLSKEACYKLVLTPV